MERTNEVLIQLIGHEVCGRQLDLPQDIMSDEQFVIDLFETAKKHDVIHIIASALKKNNFLSGIAAQAFETQLYGAVLRHEKMNHVFDNVCKALEDFNIPYIPLKGMTLKKLYPEPWMRSSSDIDILVHEQNLNSAIQALTDRLGYKQVNCSAHDITLISDDNIFIELHFRLIEDEHKIAATEILNTVWDYANPCNENSCRYTLNDSFFYFYHISHMAKHIVHGGCGIRPFLDLWLMNRNRNYSDENLKKLLKQGSMLKFADCAKQLSNVWFSGAEHSETTQILQDYIIKGGIFGTKETRMLSAQQHHGGKRKHIINRIFISHEDLAYTYPIIKKYRFLTPLCEICRLFSLLFGEKKKFRKAYLANLDGVTEEYADKIKFLFKNIEL